MLICVSSGVGQTDERICCYRDEQKKKHLSFHVDTLASLESNGGALICYFPLLALAAFHLACLSAAQLYVTWQPSWLVGTFNELGVFCQVWGFLHWNQSRVCLAGVTLHSFTPAQIKPWHMHIHLRSGVNLRRNTTFPCVSLMYSRNMSQKMWSQRSPTQALFKRVTVWNETMATSFKYTTSVFLYSSGFHQV